MSEYDWCDGGCAPDECVCVSSKLLMAYKQLQAENADLDRKYMQAYNEACDDLNGKFSWLKIEKEELQAEALLLREALGKIIFNGAISPVWIAEQALPATPETAKVQAVLDAADEWLELFDFGDLQYDDASPAAQDRLYEAVRARRENP